MLQRRWWSALATTAIVVSACTSGSSSAGSPAASGAAASAGGSSAAASAAGASTAASAPAPSVNLPSSVGPGEGALNLIAWAGYVVGGTGGEQIQGSDWVTPFEEASGCKVNVKVGLDSANMVQLMKTGQ